MGLVSGWGSVGAQERESNVEGGGVGGREGGGAAPATRLQLQCGARLSAVRCRTEISENSASSEDSSERKKKKKELTAVCRTHHTLDIQVSHLAPHITIFIFETFFTQYVGKPSI